jgi:hypothetical protein
MRFELPVVVVEEIVVLWYVTACSFRFLSILLEI